eukprot:scaffold1506_cov118-Isochrysis_galbana.AAC.5
MGPACQLSDLSQLDEPSLRVPQYVCTPEDKLTPGGSVVREEQQSHIVLPRHLLQPEAEGGVFSGRGLDAVDAMIGELTELHFLHSQHIEAYSPHKQRDAIELVARPPLVQALHALGCQLRTQPLEGWLLDLLQREYVRI